jgi:peptide/nickel transport system permease protein
VIDASTAGTAPSPAPRSGGSSRFLGAVTSNLWVRFLIRRLLGLVFVIVLLIVGVFFMIQLVPGDPVTNSLGLEATPAIVQRVQHENGFDKPLLAQFWRYVERLAHGDMGSSFLTSQPVTEIIHERIGNSLQLAGFGIAIVLCCAVPIGLVAAAYTRDGRHPKLELGFMSVTSVLGSVPELLKATVLAFVFAVQFRLLPVAGAGSFEQLILPALAVSIGPTMVLSRIVRLETLNVLAQDYMRTARSKQLPGRLIFFRHVLPNVLTATLTVAGLLFAALIGGTVVVENIFARPGLGTSLVNAVLAKEYAVVQGIVLVLGIVVVVINAIVDVILALLDPRSLARYA